MTATTAARDTILALIEDTVGDVEAADIDLDRVDHHGTTLIVGDPSRDGSVTITPDDTVAVWAQGQEAARDHVPGAYDAMSA